MVRYLFYTIGDLTYQSRLVICLQMAMHKLWAADTNKATWRGSAHEVSWPYRSVQYPVSVSCSAYCQSLHSIPKTLNTIVDGLSNYTTSLFGSIILLQAEWTEFSGHYQM